MDGALTMFIVHKKPKTTNNMREYKSSVHVNDLTIAPKTINVKLPLALNLLSAASGA